jgi:hypothetical protein
MSPVLAHFGSDKGRAVSRYTKSFSAEGTGTLKNGGTVISGVIDASRSVGRGRYDFVTSERPSTCNVLIRFNPAGKIPYHYAFQATIGIFLNVYSDFNASFLAEKVDTFYNLDVYNKATVSTRVRNG